MKYPKALGLVILLTSTIAKATLEGPTIVCHQGKAYVRDVTWDTGCVQPATPFFKTLSLESDSPEGGKITVEIGYTFRTKYPHCDNPRGTPYFFNLPLPVEKGAWEIEVAGLGKTLLKFEPTCNVQNQNSKREFDD